LKEGPAPFSQPAQLSHWLSSHSGILASALRSCTMHDQSS
jgi:hypothetical protein